MFAGKKIILLLFAVLLIIVSVVYFSFSTKNSLVVSNSKDNWLEYHNEYRNFSFRYPPELTLKEYDEGDGTYTLTFADAADEKSFQIFFTPYLGDSITQSRILKDVPSGQFTKPVEVIIGGGNHALLFFSEVALGRMREVWFLHGDYLYEVTTIADLDDWLSSILATWRFD